MNDLIALVVDADIATIVGFDVRNRRAPEPQPFLSKRIGLGMNPVPGEFLERELERKRVIRSPVGPIEEEKTSANPTVRVEQQIAESKPPGPFQRRMTRDPTR